MKIFNRDRGLKKTIEHEQIEELEALVSNHEILNKEAVEKNKKLKLKICELSQSLKEQNSINQELNLKVSDLETKNNNLNLNVESLKLEKQSLEEKLKDSMTNKYVLKKIPSGRPRNTQKIKI